MKARGTCLSPARKSPTLSPETNQSMTYPFFSSKDRLVFGTHFPNSATGTTCDPLPCLVRSPEIAQTEAILPNATSRASGSSLSFRSLRRDAFLTSRKNASFFPSAPFALRKRGIGFKSGSSNHSFSSVSKPGTKTTVADSFPALPSFALTGKKELTLAATSSLTPSSSFVFCNWRSLRSLAALRMNQRGTCSSPARKSRTLSPDANHSRANCLFCWMVSLGPFGGFPSAVVDPGRKELTLSATASATPSSSLLLRSWRSPREFTALRMNPRGTCSSPAQKSRMLSPDSNQSSTNCLFCSMVRAGPFGPTCTRGGLALRVLSVIISRFYVWT
mmetsp:Transcript_7001/g.14687  ORF Transcript_7001/g.14687 Transcript_7001/m.14687 type:complete len:332 (+) Transcript_7001:1269-2264(+)